jgi:hypothetical protein
MSLKWTAEYDDGTTAAAGPGQPFDRLALEAITCEGHRIAVPPEAEFHHFERTSIGTHRWQVGIVAVDDDIHIIYPGGRVIHQQGWGTDVLTGPPAGVSVGSEEGR